MVTRGERVLSVMGMVGEGHWAGEGQGPPRIWQLPQGWVAGWRVAGDRLT